MKNRRFDALWGFIIFMLSQAIFSHSAIAQSEMPEELPHPYTTALTVEVFGEDSKPIPDVRLRIGFYNPHHPKIARKGETEWYKDDKSSADGKLRVEEATFGAISVEAQKEGYYPSVMEYKWDIYANWKKVDAEQRLIPWNPTMKMMLKKIGDPAPMSVVTNFSKKLPGLGTEYAMDLLEGDWLPPHGKGKVLDCYFSVIGDLKSSKLIIRFPNPGDGMIRVDSSPGSESHLRFPRKAPADGYLKVVEITTVYDSYMTRPSYADNMASGYIFRIRSAEGGANSKEEALYGKLVGFSSFSGIKEWSNSPAASAIGPIFLYINPNPGDRRIEADLTRNLRKGEDPPKFP